MPDRSAFAITNKSAVIAVDEQIDFLPGGALGVENGYDVLYPTNLLSWMQAKAKGQVIFTQDWHPEETVHFKEQGGPWVPHCIQNTRGAELHENLFTQFATGFVHKGFDGKDDGYSGFEGLVFGQGIGLDEFLINHGVTKTFICGIATDYCVKATVLDSMKRGYQTFLVTDAIAEVARDSGDGAVLAMMRAGVILVTSMEIMDATLTLRQ